MNLKFRWNGWNQDHVTKHGSSAVEAESVIRAAGRGYPRRIDEGKYVVVARGQGGRLVKVIFIFSPSGVVYVIHAMPLSTRRRGGRGRS